MRILTPLLASVLLATVPLAAAAEATPESLKADVEDFLSANRGGVADGYLLLHGKVSVSAVGDSYRVTVEDLDLWLDGGGSSMLLGTVSFLTAPLDDGSYAFSEVALPSRLSKLDEEGVETLSLSFRLLQLEGIWSPHLRRPTDYKLEMTELHLTSRDLGALAGVERFATVLKTRKGADGRWTQLGDVQAERLSFWQLGDVAQLGRLVGTVLIENVDVATLLAVKDLSAALSEAVRAGDQVEVANLRERFRHPGDLSGSAHERVELHDFILGDPQAPEQAFKRLGFTVTGAAPRDSDMVSLGLTLDGELLPPTEAFAAVVPLRWNIPLMIDHVSKMALMDWASGVIAVGAAMPGDAAAGEAFTQASLDQFETLGAALRAGGARILARDLFVEGEFWRLDGKVALVLSETAALGLEGRSDLTLSGLDRLLAWTDSPGDQEGKRSISAVLLVLQGVAQTMTLPSGEKGHRYSLALSSEGAFTVNGLSLGDLQRRLAP